MSALSDALNAANVDGLSAREIARKADDRVSHSQLGKYLKPNHPRPTERVLMVFAEVFGIPITELRDLAGLPAGEREPWSPPEEVHRLSGRQQDALTELIRAIAAGQERGDGDGRDAAPMNADELGSRRTGRKRAEWQKISPRAAREDRDGE